MHTNPSDKKFELHDPEAELLMYISHGSPRVVYTDPRSVPKGKYDIVHNKLTKQD